MKNHTFKILLYHGVTDLKKNNGIENFSKKHIAKKTFFRQMKFIKNNCNVISMNELLNYSKKGFLPANSVLVTFDDGFENNFRVAVPILKKLKIPATFYITTGLIGKKELFWVDKIEDTINFSKKKIINLKLDKTKTFNISSNRKKKSAVKKIKSFCKSSKSKKKDLIINQLIEETGIKPSYKHSRNYKIMNWKQIKLISSNRLFEIGGHSHDHNILTKISKKEMKKNIKQSIETLKNKLKKKIIYFSYPEGQKTDFNNYIRKQLKHLGIKICPTAINGVSKIQDNTFSYKRIMVGINNKAFPIKKNLN